LSTIPTGSPPLPPDPVISALDSLLGEGAEVDYDGAWNGLQVEASRPIRHLAVAVDASDRVIRAAVEIEADLLLVHHGLFWDSNRRITGRRFRKIRSLLEGGMGLYASHLPLDRHPELGNSVGVIRLLGGEPSEPFGVWRGLPTGWVFETQHAPEALQNLMERAFGEPVRLIRGGTGGSRRVAVVTGAGASFLEAAREAGVDTLITGEAPHHAVEDARELGVHLILAGHYRTETFGVQAVASRLAAEHGVQWTFLDYPSGI
jgi:dinuclear metal center YbgI/SA1388 family protein